MKRFNQNFRLRSSQAGFGAIEAILIIIIIGIIGFAGWKVYDSNKTTTSTLDKNATASVKYDKMTTGTTYKIPDGWVEYENQEIGFSFAYPKEWGNVTIQNNGDKRKGIVFNTDSVARQFGEYTIVLHSKYAVHGDTDEPTANIVGFNVSKGELTIQKAQSSSDKVNAERVLFTNKDSAIYTSPAIDDNSNLIIGLKSVKLKGYDVAIFYYLTAVDSTTQPEVLNTIKQEIASFKVL